MKFLINERYRGDIHHVWCSESFDSKTLGTYASGALVPPTSNPKDVYENLKKAVDNTDRHNTKITQQISGLAALAVKWETAGEITATQKDDIVYMVNEMSYFKYWRPVLYVIPRALVEPRLKPVPMALCASLGKEYIIDLLQKWVR